MKKLLILPLLLLSLTGSAACSPEDTPAPAAGRPETPDSPDKDENPDNANQPAAGDGKTLVAYFSAEGHTKAVAERIVALTGADIFRIEAARPYAENPYDDSDRVQEEAYKDLRPDVKELPAAETMARYDTVFIGSPIWWHQPAMVVCTFLEACDLRGKTVIPFFTYGATSYLNESMQKIYRLTPESKHIPASLPEDLDPDDITRPGRPDDAGIDMPGNAGGTEAWLRRLGIIK